MPIEKIAILITIFLSAVGVLADYFLKLASEDSNSLLSRHFYIGFLIYSSTAFGWVFVMKHIKLASIGVIYPVSTALLLTALGVLVFKEALKWQEYVGVAMAVGSMLLLSSRFE